MQNQVDHAARDAPWQCGNSNYFRGKQPAGWYGDVGFQGVLYASARATCLPWYMRHAQ